MTHNKTSKIFKIKKHYELSYFGYSPLELVQTKLISANLDSVCEIISQDKSGNLKKFCYFSKGRKNSEGITRPVIIEQKVSS